MMRTNTVAAFLSVATSASRVMTAASRLSLMWRSWRATTLMQTSSAGGQRSSNATTNESAG